MRTRAAGRVLTVGELRKAMAGLADGDEVVVEGFGPVFAADDMPGLGILLDIELEPLDVEEVFRAFVHEVAENDPKRTVKQVRARAKELDEL